MFSLRQGNWKLNFCPGSGGWAKPSDADARQSGLPEMQLYDLGNDPSETRNVQAGNPAVVARLTALLGTLHRRRPQHPGCEAGQ